MPARLVRRATWLTRWPCPQRVARGRPPSTGRRPAGRTAVPGRWSARGVLPKRSGRSLDPRRARAARRRLAASWPARSGVSLPRRAPAERPPTASPRRCNGPSTSPSVLPDGCRIGGWAAAHLLGAERARRAGSVGERSSRCRSCLPPPLRIRRPARAGAWRSELGGRRAASTIGGVVCTVSRPDRHSTWPGCATCAAAWSAWTSWAGRSACPRRLCCAHAAAPPSLARSTPGRTVPLRLADPRRVSTGETRLRLFWLLDAGLPRPEVNPTVIDLDGFVLGLGDLLDPESALLGGVRRRRVTASRARHVARQRPGGVASRMPAWSWSGRRAPDVWPSNRPRTVLSGCTTARRRGLARDRGAGPLDLAAAAAAVE